MEAKFIVLLLSFLLLHSVSYTTYYSQLETQQDRFLNEYIFHNKKNGVFVDIGAHDGVSLSNTYFFEAEQEWKGICIEPNPTVFEKLKQNRSCICVQGCISDFEGNADYLKVIGAPEMLSGLVNQYDPRHLNRIKIELDRDGGHTQVIQVPCFRLNTLLDSHGISHVDYLSIDTEGGELAILKSIDYEKIDIDIIDVENAYLFPEFRAFMESKGFVLITMLGRDEIYRNKKYFKN